LNAFPGAFNPVGAISKPLKSAEERKRHLALMIYSDRAVSDAIGRSPTARRIAVLLAAKQVYVYRKG
jgi:hypothetical protein